MALNGFITFPEPVSIGPDPAVTGKGAPVIAAVKSGKELVKDGTPVLNSCKPYLFGNKTGLTALNSAQFFTRPPDAIVSFVSGTDQFNQWKRDDLRSAFQSGVVKLLGTLDLLIIDDGLDYGFTRLCGSAIRGEEIYRSYIAQTSPFDLKKPNISYLGIVPIRKLAYGEQFLAMINKGGSDFQVPAREDAGVDGFSLNRHHSHYVMVEKSYADLRVDMEHHLQMALAAKQVQSMDDSIEEETGPGFVPRIVVLFQGGLEELDTIFNNVRLRTPIVIMDGCGGLSDILAAGIRSGSGPQARTLSANLNARLAGTFPSLKTNERELKDVLDKVLQVVKMAGPPGKLCFIVDCNRPDNFSNLDVQLLQGIVNSSAEQNLNWDQLVRNFKLCITCNRSDIASGNLVSSPPWTEIPNKVSYPGMMAALIIPGREAFVDMLLQQQFPVRYLTSYLDLLILYRSAGGRDYFQTLIWDDIMGHNQSDPIGEDFILRELNALIYQFTGIKNYLDFYELSRVAFLKDESKTSPAQADANSISALIVFATLLNRPKLIKVLLKYSNDPVPNIVFVEMMYRGMYRSIPQDADIRGALKRQADEFGQIATDILDVGIRESPQRAKTFFQRPLADFNNKTVLEMAFDARNRTFIARPLVQNWLDQFGNGFVRVKGGLPEVKLVLSALLVFPMYFWLGFPRQAGSVLPRNNETDILYDPRSKRQALVDLKASMKSTKNKEVDSNIPYIEKFPPIWVMIKTVWSAPLVKFWIWFLIYIMFLIVIGTDMMMPACTNLGLDIAVFVLTALIWLELLLRTISDVLWKRRIDYSLRATDLIFQTVFNVIFFLYRIAPYRVAHPFAGRVILAFGVMYYFYSVWQMFYQFGRHFGPLIRIVIIMFKFDMPKWIVMMLPFFISTMVIWQAIITPDYPFTGEDWRRAFYRGIFTLFGAFYTELEYNEGCERTKIVNWTNFRQPADAYPQDRCWLGDYTDYTCPTVSFWAYFFVINYYFFLKLGMVIILVVFYIFRQGTEMPKANLIWRYYRFQALFEYYWRSALPFPLNILGNVILILEFFTKKRASVEGQIAKTDPELFDLKQDTFFYWKGVAADYFAGKDREEGARAIPMKQNALLGAVGGGVQGVIARFGDIEKKLNDVEEQARRMYQSPTQSSSHDRPLSSAAVVRDIAAVADPNVHIRSRESPYRGTNIQRLPVPDHKVNWLNFMENYNPDSYTRAYTAFRPEVQEFVDREIKTPEAARAIDWNTIQYDADGDAVNRRTWILDEKGDPLVYRLDINGLPLNPRGRTGLRGRGSHCRYGPNQGIILAITTTDNRAAKFIVQTPADEVPTLPNVPLCHYDSEYSVAAILIDSVFNETDSSDAFIFDPAAVKTQDDLAKVIPLLMKNRAAKSAADEISSVRVTELYRGYWDAPLNTDNAWMEALVLHIGIPAVRKGPQTNSVYHWRAYSVHDIGLLDAAIMKNLHSTET